VTASASPQAQGARPCTPPGRQALMHHSVSAPGARGAHQRPPPTASPRPWRSRRARTGCSGASPASAAATCSAWVDKRVPPPQHRRAGLRPCRPRRQVLWPFLARVTILWHARCACIMTEGRASTSTDPAERGARRARRGREDGGRQRDDDRQVDQRPQRDGHLAPRPVGMRATRRAPCHADRPAGETHRLRRGAGARRAAAACLGA